MGFKPALNLGWVAKKYFPNLTPYEIDGGDCYNWAYAVYLIMPNVKLCSCNIHGGHAFVKIGNRYYDAEHPKGVVKTKSILPELREDDFEQQSPKEFRENWRWLLPKYKWWWKKYVEDMPFKKKL